MTFDLPPPDCDLRDYPFLPLDVARLRDSAIVDAITGDEFRAAVLLWCSAWHQVPAGSLPDDDAQLAKFAGYGRVIREWLKVRPGALYGWEKGPDGRLYHPVIVEKALEAWAGRRSASKRGKAGAAKRWGNKDSRNDASAIVENSSAISTDGSAIQKNGSAITAAIEKHSNREGQGKGYGEGEEGSATAAAAAPPPPSEPDLFGLPEEAQNTPPPPAGGQVVVLVPAAERELEAAVEAYNLTADYAVGQGCKWPKCENLHETRRKKLKARLKDCGGLEGWKGAMMRAIHSDYLMGRTQRKPEYASWTPSLDFFLQLKSFTQLLEGFYDNKPAGQGGTVSGGGGLLDRAAQAAAIARSLRS
jgi:hypothetical protein